MIFTSVWALMTLTVAPALLRPGILTIHVGQTIRPRELLHTLVQHAYTPTSVVEQPGTFAQRGGIVDVYPSNIAEPIRIEWVGDQVETLRCFDPVTQRSLSRIDEVQLFPASEALSGHSERACVLLNSLYAQEASASTVQLERDQQRLMTSEYFRGLEAYLPCLYQQPATMLEYLPQDTLLLIDDPPGVELAAETLMAQAEALKADLVGERQLPNAFPAPYRPWDQLQAQFHQRARIELGYHLAGESEANDPEHDSAFHNAPVYGGRLDQLVADSLRGRSTGQWTIIVSRQAQRLAELFTEAGYPVTPGDGVPVLPPSGSITLIAGSLDEGWVLQEQGPRRPGELTLVLLTDTEVFGWARPKQRAFTRKKAVSPESFLAEIHENDHVVHIDHGIGIYRGLVSRVIDGEQREYLEIEYAEGDRLFVPVSQIDRLTRYVGGGERVPTVHRLGSAEWVQVRARAKKAVDDLAKELLELYAARQVATGHAFAPDSHWQFDLEGSFPYQETEDQMRALIEVKADMEVARPMDRLICGDVGYGKTEVAVRAAFKAVMDGKQVAVLVPTTVLAQQHTLTFRERLAAFPVEVAMLSRFCSPREARETIEKLEEGKIDIVIGTHRLLQKDVSFNDLGLLVVDEEQRFGVRHKEWLKQARQQLDVLTMTATPIPRTLYMSLGGIRDMSVIDTPPEARLPVRTQAAEFDEGIVRRAILRELNRNGQVYFVHNRVKGIRQVAQQIQKVVPEATVAIGHGQMPEDKLSQVMLDFAQGSQDVLVCTSIIESGLDIPNVNTIIINRADCFGLAQLYQLRGRVGRSTVQAYAYLLHDKHKKLSDIARRRLETILEAGELGAGFRIAMRDLEIRGAGDILGPQQHGHIAAIGLELYTRLLSQAVAERKSAKPPRQTVMSEVRLPPLIELPLQALLPDDYVADEELRIKLYQRMGALSSEQALDDIRQELEDRFGILPPPVTNLIYVLRVRLLATTAGVSAIGREDHTLVLKADGEGIERARQVVSGFGRRAWVGRGQLWLSLQGQERNEWQEMLLALLSALQPGQPWRAESA